MSLGIKIHCPYPLSLEGAGMPSAFVHLQQYYLECKVSPSDHPECALLKNKDQASEASFLLAKLNDNVGLRSHSLTVNLKNAGSDVEKLYDAVIACLKYTNHFFERKGRLSPFQVTGHLTHPSELFQAGKFAILSSHSVRHLPYPSGLSLSLINYDYPFQGVPPNDGNAFILSESLYRMDYNSLKLISIPKPIEQSFEESKELVLCLLPIVETQQLLALFTNSAEQDSFQRSNEKTYICPAELNLSGMIVQ